MFNKFKAKFDFNVVLAGARLVVVEKGKRKAYNEDTKSKKDAETFPSFIRCRLIDDPSASALLSLILNQGLILMLSFKLRCAILAM